MFESLHRGKLAKKKAPSYLLCEADLNEENQST